MSRCIAAVVATGRRHHPAAALVSIVAGLVLPAASAPTATGEFIALDAPGTYRVAHGISADGSTVVGGGVGAFRWTDGVLEALPTTLGSWTARLASDDGSVVLGEPLHRWETGHGVGLASTDPFAIPEPDETGVIALSGDGQLSLVYEKYAEIRVPYIYSGPGWPDPGGQRIDPMLPEQDETGLGFEIVGMSDDASAFLGRGWSAPFGVPIATSWLRWDATGATISSPQLGSMDEAVGLAPDGSFVFGAQGSAPAFWKDGAVTVLPALPGQTSGIVLDASPDGSVLVGRATTDGGDVAFIWSAAEGMRALASIVDVPVGWSLEEAVAVSHDGLVIAGNGTSPVAQIEAFVVDLRAQAAPSLSPFAMAALIASLTAATIVLRLRPGAREVTPSLAER